MAPRSPWNLSYLPTRRRRLTTELLQFLGVISLLRQYFLKSDGEPLVAERLDLRDPFRVVSNHLEFEVKIRVESVDQFLLRIAP